MDLPQKHFEKRPKIIVNNLNFKIGGEAGFGIMASGLIFAKSANRAGLTVHGYVEYPSLVRGGHNTYQIKVTDSNPSLETQINLLVALNKESVDKEIDNLSEFSGIIYDGDKINIKSDDFLKKHVNLFSVPLEKIANDSGGGKLMDNTVALGAAFAVLEFDFEYLSSVLMDTFGSKGQEVVNLNIKAAKNGFEFGKKYKDGYFFKLERISKDPKIVISGNEAVGLGTIAAGCKFYASYPMTPSSTILHYLAANQVKADMIVKHAADEIEAVNMAIGASFAGVRSSVGTSGGGFALMAEAYGLAGITETPLVLIDVQRPGPATGMPTWTGQADLDFVLSAGQDDFPAIVIAPGDVREAFEETINAHNLAQKYQTTVMILSDKYLGESVWNTLLFENEINTKDGEIFSQEKDFKRYLETDTGISPRSIPGEKGGKYIANSYEHDEYGFTTEDPNIRIKMMDKRMKKLESLKENLPDPILYGEDEAQITLIGWGSTKTAIIPALEILKVDGIKANFLHFVYLNPFADKKTNEILTNAKEILVCEGNYTGQLANLIVAKTGIKIENKLLKYDGRPFYPDEIVKKVKELV